MDLLTIMTSIGAGITLIGVVRYVFGILNDGTKPRLASWIAWLMANAVFTILAVLDGALLPAIFNGLAVLGNISILIAATVRKAGHRPSGLTDWLCLSVASTCVLLILVFPSFTTLGAVLAITANLIASWPTLLHAWKKPREETWQLFAANVVAGLLALAGVVGSVGWELSLIAGPLVVVLGNTAMVTTTLGRRYKIRPGAMVELQEDLG